MTNRKSSPVAIIEIATNGLLLAINQVAIDLLSLPKALLPKTSLHQTKETVHPPKQDYYFDYYRILNLNPNQPLSELISTTIVINQQYYLLQLVNNHIQVNNCIQSDNCMQSNVERLTFIIQPISYLNDCLSNKGVANQQAFNVFGVRSTAMQQLIKQAKAFSKQKEPLLISGATGTGKDLLALACHQYSQRGDQIFLGLNCAAMPDDVVESELYGYAAGAYSGSIDGKKGFFEQANGGSVLLDGIDEMSFSMQTKLIRFINDGCFRRVGDDNEVNVDVRIICATKADLYSLVKQGKFREDLYYRLNVLPLYLPPLTERKEDIIDLANSFICEFMAKQGNTPLNMTLDAQTLLLNYRWPGNVRQLKNILYLALARLNGDEGSSNKFSTKELTAKDIELPDTVFPLLNSPDGRFSLSNESENRTLDEMMKQFEKNILINLYNTYPSSRKLSKRLGLSHTAVANKLREYGIRR